ncbi:MAG: hypothetical protein COA33_015060 [Fluviicola sp.]|nr:hypothetical protein [Fluviicola sp.]
MRLTLLLFVALFFYSCTENKTEVHVIFNSGEGLEKEMDVILNEQKIGEIIDLDFNSSYEIVATISIDKKLNLPEDSRFTSQSVDLFTDAIVVLPGISKTSIQNGDTLFGETAKSISIDTMLIILNDAIENSAPMKKQDSLIKVIKELTDEVEGLK